MKTSVFALTTALLVGSTAAFVSRSAAGPSNFSARTSSLNMAIDDPMAFAKEQIANNDIMVFSKSYCPHCAATKTVFEKMDGVDATIFEMDLDDDGQSVQDALLEISGQKTVPNVFVKGTHIGGNDDTQLAAKMGKIKKMLKE